MNLRNKTVHFFIACLLIAQPISAMAAAPKTPSYPFAIFLGLDAGFAALGVGSNPELGKKGVQFALKGIASFYGGNRYVYDLGLGWSYTRVVGEIPTKIERNYLRMGIVEGGIRYRFDDFWQFGPYLNIGFGADQSFSVGPNDQPGVVFYPGLQLFHEDTFRDHPIRWGGRVGTGLGTPGGRHLWTIEACFQFGFPFKRAPQMNQEYDVRQDAMAEENHLYTQTRAEETNEVYSTPWAEEAMQLEVQETTKTVVLRMQEIPLQKELTHFKTGSAELSPQSKKYLRNLGAFLSRNPKLWRSLQIEGHTDVRGALAMNMKLSRARAVSVAKAIHEGGANRSAMKTLGFGPKKPIDPRNNPEAWSKNRRVEIKFLGVDNPSKLAEGIRAIKGQ